MQKNLFQEMLDCSDQIGISRLQTAAKIRKNVLIRLWVLR